ncbi:hypothetical protein LOTGIDRAFT_136786, partial [Lottia gigantea]
QPENAKILRISLIGAPNAGKSTLTNSLMNWKVSSVSNKVHTTRKNTLAVCTEDETQIIFLDTPGVLDPAKRKRHNLEASMVTDPEESVSKADMIGVLVDVSDTWTRTALNKYVLKILHLNKHIPSILILNKVDLVKHKGVLLKICQKLLNDRCGGKPLSVNSDDNKTSKEVTLKEMLSQYHDRQSEKELENETGWSHFSNVFMVAAKRDDGVKELKEYLKGMAKPGDWQYHSSIVTDKSPQEVAISLVQEQLLEHLALEIPYKILPVGNIE